MARRAAAAWWLTTRWLRRHWISAVPIAVVVAAGTTGAVVATNAADRTSTAYDDHLRRGAVGDVVVNPSMNTREVDAVIRSLPGVVQATSHSLFFATSDDGAPRSRRALVEGEEIGPPVLIIGSSDGRYLETDRPAVHAGRLPTGTSEAVLTLEAAEQTGLDVGDTVPLAFWAEGIPPVIDAAGLEAFADEVVEPIGVEQVEIVGIVALHDEVLPDELYPRAKAIVSPDIAARYDCLPPSPPPGVTYAEAVAAFFPSNCATQYRYYSLTMADGDTSVEPALGAFIEATTPMTVSLQSISDKEELGLGNDQLPSYFLVPTATDLESARVGRAVRPTVAALTVLALAVALVTVVLALLLAARALRGAEDEQRQWHQMGVAPTTRRLAAAMPIVLATVVGTVAGIVAGWLFDGGPVGPVGVLDPDPAQRLGAPAVLTALAVGLLVVGGTSVLVVRALSTSRGEVGAPRAALHLDTPVGAPAVAEGMRSAFGTRAAIPIIAAVAVVTASLVAAAVFAASLARLVSTPASYGWVWDAAVMTGAGYGDADVEGAADLAADAAVESSTWLGFINEVTLDGEAVLSVIGFDRSTDVTFPVLDGELPRAANEVAVGATTAADRGLEVGDSVQLAGSIEPMAARVAGIVVFPAIGPLLADRVGGGSGLLLAEDIFTAATFSYDQGGASDLATFLGLQIRDGTDRATIDRLTAELGTLSLTDEPFLYDSPVRPPEIIGAASTRAVPSVVGAVLATVATVGLGFASWGSVRARRRELAILRAIGFDLGQVRRTVHVQSVATVFAAMVVGVPAGIVVGRALWNAFADQLGVVVDHAAAWPIVTVAIAAGAVIAMAASVIPARLATGTSPADGLRAE